MTHVPDRLSAALAGRYRIERELGAGGMATVYLCEDVKHKRKVALKLLRPELAAVLGAERFVQEITTTAALQHPHILPLFDSGEADGFLYYVMPFIDGETLRAKLDREMQLGVEEAVRIASDVASALHYAHTHGVIHRDIKPENILLHDGRPMVADFGIALAVSAAAGGRMTETGLSLGTPHYMSPEQATAEKEISARSDVYSLGSVLYEMLTGDPPHTGSSAQQIIMKIITTPADLVTVHRKSVPANVAAAVARSLEKLPADRFESAKAFAEALANPNYTSGLGGTGAGAAAPARGVSRRTFAVTAAVAAIAVAIALALATRDWSRTPAPAGIARFEVELWRGQFENSLMGSAQTKLASMAAIAPDGSSIVFTDSLPDGVELRIKQRGESASESIPGTKGGRAPFFSPDGEWVGYIMEDGRIRKVPARGGGSVDIVRDANNTYLLAVWLDDGTIIYRDDGANLRRVSADGGPSVIVGNLAALGGRFVTTISPLPDSRGVLFTSCQGSCTGDPWVGVLDLRTDSVSVLVSEAAGAWYAGSGRLLYTLVGGGLYAAELDLSTLKITSGATAILPDVSPTEFTISPSGTVLYQTGAWSNSADDLVWVSRSGEVQPVDATWTGDFNFPALSPDGQSIAVSVTDGSTQLWIRRADASRQKLTLAGAVNWRPSWRPDGRTIGYSGLPAGQGTALASRDLFEIPADGSGAARLVLDLELGIWETEYSRDGRWMVYRPDDNAGTSSEIWARRLDGDSTAIPIAVGPGFRRQPALSPDARWLAFTSDESGRGETYVMSFPDGKVKRLVSQGGGTEPRWSGNGRELFFKSRGSLMVVAIPAGPALVPGVPRPLFSVAGYRAAQNRQQYDVSPDGQRFLMIRQLGGSVRRQLVYAENWFEELDAKMRR
jgi:serine/threonine-protein kinase